MDTGPESCPPFCRRKVPISLLSITTLAYDALTASIRKMTSTGGSAVAAPLSASRKDTIFRGCLSSRSVKSRCCRPGTGFPDLSVTTTSSKMLPFALTSGTDAGGPDCPAGPFRCANPESSEKQSRQVQPPRGVLIEHRLYTRPRPGTGHGRSGLGERSSGVVSRCVLSSSRGLRLLFRRRFPCRRPTFLGRFDDPRPPLGAQTALFVTSFRGRRRRRRPRSSLGFPGRRPASPLRSGHAPARGGA